MSKCVVVDIKEPDSAASADFSDTEIGVAQKKKAIYDAEDEPRPALNPHIQDIQLLHLKIGDHMVVFQAREGDRVADKIAKEDLFFFRIMPLYCILLPSWLNVLVEGDNV
ncbi:unnamed protein product [Brassica oleracea var. botrytis]